SGVLCISESLAAPGAGAPVARRGWHATSDSADAGIRISGGGMGVGSLATADRKVRARLPRPALPVGRGELGQAVAAPGIRARRRRERTATRATHASRSARDFPPG